MGFSKPSILWWTPMYGNHCLVIWPRKISHETTDEKASRLGVSPEQEYGIIFTFGEFSGISPGVILAWSTIPFRPVNSSTSPFSWHASNKILADCIGSTMIYSVGFQSWGVVWYGGWDYRVNWVFVSLIYLVLIQKHRGLHRLMATG